MATIQRALALVPDSLGWAMGAFELEIGHLSLLAGDVEEAAVRFKRADQLCRQPGTAHSVRTSLWLALGELALARSDASAAQRVVCQELDGGTHARLATHSTRSQ